MSDAVKLAVARELAKELSHEIKDRRLNCSIRCRINTLTGYLSDTYSSGEIRDMERAERMRYLPNAQEVKGDE